MNISFIDLPMTWHTTVVTLFPEMFPGHLNYSLAGKAKTAGVWDLQTVFIRDFGLSSHKNVDDTVCGGGPGMIMRPDVIHNALCHAQKTHPKQNPKIIFLSPRGTPLTQNQVRSLASHEEGCIFLCGHFEGIDDRVIQHWHREHDLMEVSLGDYILSGGEVAALTLLDACIRTLPGVIGDQASLEHESFELELLEYPQYTRPRSWLNNEVPPVLLSGNHREIETWRRQESERITQQRRPDLWARRQK